MVVRKSTNAYPVNYQHTVVAGKKIRNRNGNQIETILNRIATDVANFNMKIDPELKNHDELKVMLQIRPTLKMPAVSFWTALVKETLVSEYSGIWVKRDSNGAVIDLEVAQNVSWDEDKKRFEFTLENQTTSKYVKSMDHLIFKNPMWQSSAYADWIMELINSHLNDLDLNGVPAKSPRFAILQPGQTDISRAMDVHQSEFEEILAHNVDGFISLPEGSEIKQLQQWSQTSDKETRDGLVNQLCSIFGISPAVFKGEFTEEQWLAYNKTILMPLRRMIQDELNSKLVDMESLLDDNRINITENTIDMVSAKDRAQIIDKMTYNGAFSLNDARELIGMPASEIEALNLHFGNRNQALIVDENEDLTPIARGESVSHSTSQSTSQVVTPQEP